MPRASLRAKALLLSFLVGGVVLLSANPASWIRGKYDDDYRGRARVQDIHVTYKVENDSKGRPQIIYTLANHSSENVYIEWEINNTNVFDDDIPYSFGPGPWEGQFVIPKGKVRTVHVAATSHALGHIAFEYELNPYSDRCDDGGCNYSDNYDGYGDD